MRDLVITPAWYHQGQAPEIQPRTILMTNSTETPAPAGRIEQLLSDTLFFKSAPPELLAELAMRCAERVLEPGEIVCEKGDPGDALYIVDEGSLEIYLGDAVLDVSYHGACLGEMALLTGETRSASIRAQGPARIQQLSLEDFRATLESYPQVVWGMFRELTAKMQSSIEVRVEQNRLQRQLEEAFERSVSKAVMDEIMGSDDPSELLHGQNRRATVLFSDIRGFTAISEHLTPAQIVQLLNEYLEAMVDVIMDCGGTLDKFMGDGILAHFGIPLTGERDAENAVRCAVEMHQRLAELNRAGTFVSRRPLAVGVGLATGELVAGCIGSERRMEYTAIGDTVNLASRLEGMTKQYRAPVIIAGDTATALGPWPGLRRIDRVRVKGRAQPAELYAVGLPSEDQDVARRLVEDYGAAFALYDHGRFAEATLKLAELEKTYPEDGPTAVLAERCRLFVAHPPEDWDGVFTHSVK